MQQKSEPSQEINVWDLRESPFVYEARKPNSGGASPWSLDAFLAFARSPKARGYEISRMGYYVMVLRLWDADGSCVLYEAHRSNMSAEDKGRLPEIMRTYPTAMAGMFREKMGRVADLFFS